MMRATLIKLPIVFYHSIFVRLNSDLLFVGGVHDNNRSWWYPSIGTLCLLCAVGCLLSNECWLSIFYFGWINDWDCHYLNGKKNMSSAWIWIVNNTDNQRAKAMELASILFNCPEHFFHFRLNLPTDALVYSPQNTSIWLCGYSYRRYYHIATILLAQPTTMSVNWDIWTLQSVENKNTKCVYNKNFPPNANLLRSDRL